MIYRILIDDFDPGLHLLLALGARDPGLDAALREVQQNLRREAVRRLAGIDAYGALMNGLGLKAPPLKHHRARFYFTERGWVSVGRHVAAAAQREGHLVKVIRRKEPDSSQVVFRDALQVALLPRKDAHSDRKGPRAPCFRN